MAEENLKDFTINWILTGALFICLLSFAALFIFNNNPTGLGDSGDVFNTTKNNLSSRLFVVSDDADEVLNITANTNPEVSDLGSRDSVASAYSAKQTSKGFWESIKQLLGWTFSGDVGKMFLVTFSGIIGFLAFYYIVKFIRNGI